MLNFLANLVTLDPSLTAMVKPETSFDPPGRAVSGTGGGSGETLGSTAGGKATVTLLDTGVGLLAFAGDGGKATAGCFAGGGAMRKMPALGKATCLGSGVTSLCSGLLGFAFGGGFTYF